MKIFVHGYCYLKWEPSSSICIYCLLSLFIQSGLWNCWKEGTPSRIHLQRFVYFVYKIILVRKKERINLRQTELITIIHLLLAPHPMSIACLCHAFPLTINDHLTTDHFMLPLLPVPFTTML